MVGNSQSSPCRVRASTATAILLILALTAPAKGSDDASLHIGVAANFRPAIEVLAQQFEQVSGIGVVISSASSGVLYSQAFRGAPYDVVLSADQHIPQQLAAALNLSSTPFCYAIGNLVLLGGTFEDLANPAKSLAIANPATAPYGKAALEVLAMPRFNAGKARKLVRRAEVRRSPHADFPQPRPTAAPHRASP